MINRSVYEHYIALNKREYSSVELTKAYLEQIEKKDKKGKPIPSSIKISFQDADINSRLSKYIAAKEIKDHMAADRDSFDNEEDYLASLDAVTSDIEEIKNHLIDSNRVVRKDTSGITIKMD